MCEKIKFDKEYATSFIKEKQFLDKCGVKYVFVKQINGITTFKYEKNRKLFETLLKFYA